MICGVQISGFRPVMQSVDQVGVVFEKLRGMGVTVVQNQWIGESVPDDAVKAAMDLNGIRCVSVQEKSDLFLKDPERYLKQLVKWNCTSLTLSSVPAQIGETRFALILERIMSALKAEGMRLMFHPLAADLRSGAADRLLKRMDGLMLLADLYHVRKAGLDPVSFLGRYPGRIGMVHLKDEITFPDGRTGLVPLGRSGYDWKSVLEVCRVQGIGFALAEQEKWEGDPFREMEESVSYLRSTQLFTCGPEKTVVN